MEDGWELGSLGREGLFRPSSGFSRLLGMKVGEKSFCDVSDGMGDDRCAKGPSIQARQGKDGGVHKYA